MQKLVESLLILLKNNNKSVDPARKKMILALKTFATRSLHRKNTIARKKSRHVLVLLMILNPQNDLPYSEIGAASSKCC